MGLDLKCDKLISEMPGLLFKNSFKIVFIGFSSCSSCFFFFHYLFFFFLLIFMSLKTGIVVHPVTWVANIFF